MALSRRAFLRASGGGVAAILASRIPPARGQQWEISYLCWNNFAPASDKKLSEIGHRFTKDTGIRSEEHTSELQSQSNLVCRLLLEKKKKTDVDSDVSCKMEE